MNSEIRYVDSQCPKCQLEMQADMADLSDATDPTMYCERCKTPMLLEVVGGRPMFVLVPAPDALRPTAPPALTHQIYPNKPVVPLGAKRC